MFFPDIQYFRLKNHASIPVHEKTFFPSAGDFRSRYCGALKKNLIPLEPFSVRQKKMPLDEEYSVFFDFAIDKMRTFAYNIYDQTNDQR